MKVGPIFVIGVLLVALIAGCATDRVYNNLLAKWQGTPYIAEAGVDFDHDLEIDWIVYFLNDPSKPFECEAMAFHEFKDDMWRVWAFLEWQDDHWEISWVSKDVPEEWIEWIKENIEWLGSPDKEAI